jgi:hypothetical protein
MDDSWARILELQAQRDTLFNALIEKCGLPETEYRELREEYDKKAFVIDREINRLLREMPDGE